MKKINKKKLIAELNKLEVTDIPAGITVAQLKVMLKEAKEANKPLEDDQSEDKNEDDKEDESTDEETVEDDSDESDVPEEDDDEEDDEDDKEIIQDEEDEEEEEEEEKDYLLKFQFGKDDNGPFRIGDPRSNPAQGSKAEIMKKQLLKQQKVTIMIPVPDGDDESYPHSVTLNGYRLDIPRNTYVELPKQVGDLIMISQKQKAEALRPMLVDRKKDIEEALE